MVLSADVIRKNSLFHVTWVFATGDSKKLTRKEVLGQKISKICTSIIEMVPEKHGSYHNKASLYLLSLLTYGTVLVHRFQVDFLQKDVERLKELLKKKSIVVLLAEQFDKEQEKRKQLRSQPITSIEEIDSWINLDDLAMISEGLGINGDVRELTMMDALPDWSAINADATGLYGSIDQFSSQNNNISTFVEGNGSDERERLTNAVFFDFDDMVANKTPQTFPRERSIHDESRKRSVLQPELENRPHEHIDDFVPPFEKQPDVEEAGDPLKYAQCSLVDPSEQSNQDSFLDRPQEPATPITPLTQQQEIPEAVVDPKEQQKEPDQQPPEEQVKEAESQLMPEQPEPAQDPPLQEPQPAPEPFHQIEDLDFPNVSRTMQDQVIAFYDQVANLPDDSLALPPPPRDDFDLPGEPPPKKQRTGDEDVDEDMEKARQRASSRAMTPVTPQNRTDLTGLQTTIRTDSDEEELELSFKLDSQIHQPIPQKKKSRRLPPIYGDDLEIDVSVQKALSADWSSLVRKMDDVRVKIPSKTDSVCADMFLPAPYVSMGRRFAEELLDAFRTGTHPNYLPSAVTSPDQDKTRNDEPSEDVQMKFATVCLFSPGEQLEQQQFEEEQRTRVFFDDEYRPLFEEPLREPAPLVQQQEEEDQQLKFAQAYLRPPTPLEAEQILEPLQEPLLETLQEPAQESQHETLKFASANLLPRVSEQLQYAQVSLLPTPEKIMEAQIIEDLQLDPFPAGDAMATLDYSHQRQMQHSEDVENPRRRQKSSMGLRSARLEDLEQDSEEREYRERLLRQEQRYAQDPVEEDPFSNSSGPTTQNNRFLIHEELLTEAREKRPEWIDFNEFTATFSRKKAATSFEGLLLNLKNQKLRAKQDEPFGTILVQHIDEISFDNTQ